MALSDNLVAAYLLESDGSDSVGSYDLTLNNSPSFVSGKNNNCVDLEASSTQYLSRTDNLDVSLASDQSISLWFTVEASPTSGNRYNLIHKADDYPSNSSWVTFYYNNSGTLILYSAGGAGYGTDTYTTTLSLDTFYHLVVTLDYGDGSSRTMKTYLNGSEVMSSNMTAAWTPGTADKLFHLGNQANVGSREWDGKLDECYFWDRVLTSSEVTELYNSGSGKFYPFTSTTIGKVSGVTYANVAKVNGVTKANIAKINGIA